MHAHGLLDAPREVALDRVTTLAAELFDVPMAVVTMVAEDRIWFAGRHGVELAEVEQIEREPGLCLDAILQREVWVVEDAATDERVQGNSLVTGPLGLRFYAGAPLVTPDGALGTLALLDRRPRTLDAEGIARLTRLAELVVDVLTMRHAATELLAAAEVDTDRTAAELRAEVERRSRAEAGQRLLADVSGQLLRAPTLDVALDAISKRVLPALGQGSGVGLLDEHGYRTTHVAHIDPRAVPLLGRARDASEASRADEVPPLVAHVVETGEPLVCTLEEALTWPGSPEVPDVVEMLDRLGIAWLLVVPMLVRDQAVGALTVLTTDPDAKYDAQDIQLAVEIAERVGTVIENDRLRRAEVEIAEALQGSLLPPVLPRIPGIDIAAHYRAAGPADIGGDFYDVFSNDGTTWNVLLGDVSGKGAEAAAIAGLARYTARALSLSDTSPATILERLNVAVERQSQAGKYLTALCASVRHVDGRVQVELADAGHPPALVRRADGTVEEVHLAGTILGMFPTAQVASSTLWLEPDDVLVLYTDGATEARRPDGSFLGLDGLADALAAIPARRPANIARGIIEVVEAVDGGDPHDDLALVVLRVQVPPTE